MPTKGDSPVGGGTETGAAGLAVKPYKPRCHFGRSHSWLADPFPADDAEETYQCWNCGAVSSNHPAANGDHQ